MSVASLQCVSGTVYPCFPSGAHVYSCTMQYGTVLDWVKFLQFFVSVDVLCNLYNVWLHSSVGRASHRYRGGHAFESRWSPDFFQTSSFQLLKLENLLRWSLFTCIYNRSTNMNYFIYSSQSCTFCSKQHLVGYVTRSSYSWLTPNLNNQINSAQSLTQANK